VAGVLHGIEQGFEGGLAVFQQRAPVAAGERLPAEFAQHL